MTATPQTSPPASAVPPTQTIFCPSCLKRMKIRADLPKGKRVRCPGCQQPVDPHSAAAVGSGRLKTEAAVRADAGDWPEWVWAIVIGVGNGLLFGGIIGTLIGLLFGSFFMDGSGDNLAIATIVGAFVSAGFYAALGTIIALSMVFTGSSVVAYIVGAVLCVPMYLIVGRIGFLATLGFVVLIERVVEWKIYS